jgi:hypothetical protein
MDIDEIRRLLPNYKINKYNEVYHISINDGNSYVRNYSVEISKISSVIDKIIDMYNNYKMIIEFLLLNNFKQLYEYYTRTINDENIYIGVDLYKWHYIIRNKKEKCFTSNDLITHLRKILDLESLNKPVIKNE